MAGLNAPLPLMAKRDSVTLRGIFGLLPGRTIKLLIADGDDELRSLLAKELEERGIETRQSCSGDEALYGQ
jgi:hypothetical protein